MEGIECRQAFVLSKIDIQSAGVTLKMCQGHQNLIIFAPCLNGVSMQFGQNPPIGSGDSVQTRLILQSL